MTFDYDEVCVNSDESATELSPLIFGVVLNPYWEVFWGLRSCKLLCHRLALKNQMVSNSS